MGSKSNSQLGKTLLALRGALKPAKCFLHLISFKFKGGGTWSYESNENEEEFFEVVPLADVNFAHIDHLGVHELINTLGSMTCPSGCNKGAINYMLTKSTD